jgi:phospholipid/cholesterol/gamma-HCH transport system substrate-binding protein
MKRRLLEIRKNILYIKVGSFFLIAFVLLLLTLLSIREFNFFKGTYLLIVKFNFAEGLRAASPVRFCGVDVGEVKRVEIKETQKTPVVYVYAKIQKDVRIPKNSYFFINSLSLFGEKYLEITPPPQINGYLKEKEIVEGISPTPLFNVFSTFHKTMEEVSEFVKEGKLKTTLENTLDNFEKLSLEMKGLVEDIKSQKGTVGKLLYDDSLYNKIEEFIDDLKRHPWKLLYKPRERRKRRR